ncbi:hypothetical protein F511_43095 [Dorcoceras hygrometricum]|uniref:Uncharacterized protein n=1 Tax=Dorcoceras hygrometricum TaxID=472368 RepID=A0A2Z7ALI4_9LAMI|nr:hypothetical protein F511_43095 [Dorcoceras hygrometricum]
MGKEIKLPGVDEKTQYLASLPKIPVDNKGKAILVENDPVKGNPAKEHYSLIFADIDLLVHLRAQWKNNFVPGKGSSANDLKVIDMLSDLHLFVLEELREQALAHALKWTRTCCSKIVEGSPRDRGAIIARTNTNTPSTCWLRTMIRVDGVWVVEPFCDQWVKIPRPVVCTEVSRQCYFVDFFPVVSGSFRLLRKRWADVCLKVVEFCNSRKLLPVGSINFCGSLSVDAPVYRVAPHPSLVFTLRVSQFCTVFIDYSLFSWLPTADITDFLSSIVMDRTVFRSVQIAQNTVSVAPIVQMIDEPSSSESSSDDTLMDFVGHDTTAATSHSPPTISADVQNVLDQLRASVDLIHFFCFDSSSY